MTEWWQLVFALVSVGVFLEIAAFLVMVWAIYAVLWPRVRRWLAERSGE